MERPSRRQRTDSADGATTTVARRRLRLQLRVDARLLDRVVRGRVWIPLLAILLVGIVAMRVEVLKLGAKVGDATKLATQLESRNQVLRNSVSQLSSDQRIEQLAQSYGMVMPGPMDDHFAQAGARLSKAMSSITQPQPTTFLYGLQAERTANSDTAAAIATGAGLRVSSASTNTVGSTNTAGSSNTSTSTSSAGTSAGGSAANAGAGTPSGSTTGATGPATGTSAPAGLGSGSAGTSGVAATGTQSGTAATTSGTTAGATSGATSAAGTGTQGPTYGSSSGGASIGG